MHLHSGSYTLPWHTTDSSDLSMQWAQLPRPYSSTDQSSSVGSMESLDTPTPTAQPYPGSHNSPVDPALFNNKRDSAYSSFSASSNTSDYATVPLRPGEACSMDNLLQSLGPACQTYPGDPSTPGIPSGEAPDLIVHKSRSLTRPRPRPAEVKERPSSCCYEQERKGGGFEMLRNGEARMEGKDNPPQPPTRKDSFRATRSHTDASKRCTTAHIGDCSVSSYEDNIPCLNAESVIPNGFPAPEEVDQLEDLQMEEVDSRFIQRQTDELQLVGYTPETASGDSSVSVATPESPITISIPVSVSSESSTEVQAKHSSAGLHRHSAPEKLLTAQLQLLQFNKDNYSVESYNTPSSSDPTPFPCSSRWSDSSSVHAATNDHDGFQNQLPSNKWGGSRCSTPGSEFLGEDDNVSGERLEENLNGRSRSPIHCHVPWGRSMSVPGEPTGSSPQERLSSDQIAESDFQPLSAAASVDTLLQEQAVVEKDRCGPKQETPVEKEENGKKSNSSKNYRRNRRRNERFATNLRNEIQRKKAQLQRSHGPGGLLCSKETVQEEEGSDHCEEETDSNLTVQKKIAKVAFASPAVLQNSQMSLQVRTSNTPSESNCDILQTQSTTYSQNNSQSRSVQILDPGVPSFGVGIRVVEEPAPAGKARRWRWTPEHKLQPEPDGDQQFGISGERVLGVSESHHGVCAFTSSSSSPYSRPSSYSRKDESDILPFAERMKFFEETCKGRLNASSASSYGQKKTERHPAHQAGEFSQHSTQRRYSYQGGLQQESVQLPNTVEARRQSVMAVRERERFRELEEREERLREMERQQEMERRERELECAREREIQQEREQEERVRWWEREREMKREGGFQLTSYQEFYDHSGIAEREEDFQHKEHFYNLQSNPPTFSQSHIQNHAPQSAFYPVGHHLPPLENHQDLHQGYTARSYTPTETCHTRPQETTALNRKYSLTERDYPGWRRESRPPQSLSQHQHRLRQARWDSRRTDGRGDGAVAPPPAPLFLRGRAMSENDLRFESSHRWSPSLFSSTSQMLSEAEEAGDSTGPAPARQSRKKAPPRPPPPKWEQFHRRRASHHAPPPSSSAAAPSTGGQYSARSSSYVPPPETSRQRSYSLPPERQDVAETCPRCSCSQTQAQEHAPSNQNPALFQGRPFTVAPPSPMFSRRMFRPVAPPHAETTVSSSRMMDASLCLDPDRVAVQPHNSQLSVRPGAEWERTPSPRVHSNTPPSSVLENGNVGRNCPAESCFSQMDLQQKLPEPETESEPEPTLSPSPAHSLELPLETDIDDFQEEELPAEDEPLTSELPCFAQPVTVLETDIDLVPDPEASPSGPAPAESSCVGEAEENRRGGLSLEEILLQSGEGESGPDSWRGASQPVESNSLDRRSSCSYYYQTSAAKAQLLSQMKDVPQGREGDEDDQLTYKKQLMESLRKKLGVLREAQRGLQEDIRANAQLGDEVESLVVSVCKPNEVDKYRMFIGDLDKVVSLMLSLSGRLLRVETALAALDSDTEQHERLPLLEKKRQLMRQLSEAQDLKDHVDRREQAVSRVLASCLTPEQHRDYSHFVKMKAALLVEQRQLEDKIRLGEEQLRGLRESLGLGMGLGLGMSMGYGQF